MRVKELFSLPASGAGCGRLRIVASSVRLDAEFEYFSDELDREMTAILRFEGIKAFRFRQELLSLGFVKESYDNLVEILESDWYCELLALEPRDVLGSIRGRRHFAVFLSNNGYLEVIAEDFVFVSAHA